MSEGEWVPDDTREGWRPLRNPGEIGPQDSGMGAGELKVEITELSVGLAVKCWRLSVGLVPGQVGDSGWGGCKLRRKCRSDQPLWLRASWTPFLNHWVLTHTHLKDEETGSDKEGPKTESGTGAQVSYLTPCFMILNNFGS